MSLKPKVSRVVHNVPIPVHLLPITPEAIVQRWSRQKGAGKSICRTCGVQLVVGTNYYHWNAKVSHRRCNSCYDADKAAKLKAAQEAHDPSAELPKNRRNKSCRVCEVSLTAANWYKCQQIGSSLICKTCSVQKTSNFLKTLTPERHVKRRALNEESRLNRVYNMHKGGYLRLLEMQGGTCYICKGPPGKRKLLVDHCHTTGHVRKLLCANCNSGLGMFRENPNIMHAAIDYLREHAAAAAAAVANSPISLTEKRHSP